MKLITVTRKSNVEDVTQDGEIILVDEENIGYLGKTHANVVHVPDADGNATLGFLARVEVFWEHQRSPAPSLEDPNDLVWLELSTEEEEEDHEDQDIEEDDEETRPIHDVSIL